MHKRRGREIKHTGDGFLATFDRPARAIEAPWGQVP
jgi:class 3 adenylate cyclase